MYHTDFQKRIQYQGDPRVIFEHICRDYNFGTYLNHVVVPLGYEDYNIVLMTSEGTYFVKCFASFRSQEECERYVDVMVKVAAAGISHPKLYTSSQGYLYKISLDGSTVRLCVLEYIDGQTFYESKLQPTDAELMELIKQAAKINSLDIHPPHMYDSWACVNFLNEYERNKKYLKDNDARMVARVADRVCTYDLRELPHSFVHGDLIRTNVMRSKTGVLYLLDFAVANWYPRVQELAVLFCDMFFDENNPGRFPSLYKRGLDKYRSVTELTSEEIEILPIYTQMAHAMHILCPIREREAHGNTSKENGFWLELGRKGLAYTLDLWS